MSHKNIKTAFSGANTGKGFVSFYDSIFSEESFAELYIIKGGSGTGKSTFMHRLSDSATQNGYTVSHYLCGSDPSSLDGIIIESDTKKIGVLDGTPPHPKELRCPGASGDILNFGAFWNSKGLRDKRAHIEKAVKGKSTAFETAYRYLGAAQKVNCHIGSLMSAVYLSKKGNTAAEKLVESIGSCGKTEYLYLSGYTMKGAATLPPAEDPKIYNVSGNTEIGSMFLDSMAKYAERKGVHTEIALSPLDLLTVESVYFPESNIWITVNRSVDNAEKTIHTERFTDKAELSLCRQKLKFGKKCREALLDGAAESLAEAGKYHFELEKIYKEHMDFNRLTEQFKIWNYTILSQL